MRIAARMPTSSTCPCVAGGRAGRSSRQLEAACEAAGRDPATLTRSAMVGVLVGRDAGEVRERDEADHAGRAWRPDAGSGVARRARGTRWIIGTPDEARARIGQYANAGVERMMLQDFVPWDLDMIDLMGKEIVGRM